MIVRARSQANCSVSYKIQVIFHDKEFKNNYKNANITKIQTPYGKHHMGGSTIHEWYSSWRAELEIWRVLNKIDWLTTISLTSSLRKYRGMEKARKKG